MSETFIERRQHTHALIKELLEERQQMWTLYSELGGMQPFDAERDPEAKLREFCQVLIDYISLGHFGIYKRLTDATERREAVLQVAKRVYQEIMAATDRAIEFNDKYEDLAGENLRDDLAGDLSRLGEAMASRIELEDQLLKAMVS